MSIGKVTSLKIIKEAMKRIIFLYIIAGALVFASCADDTPPTAKYVTVNLQIGGDSTLNISGGSTSFDYSSSAKEFIKKPISATRAVVDGINIPDFVPEVPKKFTAYIVASDINNEGWIIKEYTAEVHTGSNNVTIQAPNHEVSYRVYVTNYPQNLIDWYIWPDALKQMPESSPTLYLYGKSKLTFTSNINDRGVLTGEVKMINPYAAVCVYKNEYVTGAPYDYNHTTTLSGNWYYLYINCFWGWASGTALTTINVPTIKVTRDWLGTIKTQNVILELPTTSITNNNIYQFFISKPDTIQY